MTRPGGEGTIDESDTEMSSTNHWALFATTEASGKRKCIMRTARVIIRIVLQATSTEMRNKTPKMFLA